ncbi:MAG: hypothetical protein U1E62_24935 [Alsobacter sp.]
MLRLSILLWALVGTTLAGTFILAVVSVPGLAEQAMRLIPWAALAGALLAVPVAVFVANAITRSARAA